MQKFVLEEKLWLKHFEIFLYGPWMIIFKVNFLKIAIVASACTISEKWFARISQKFRWKY